MILEALEVGHLLTVLKVGPSISLAIADDMRLVASILAHEGVRESVWDDGGPQPLPVHPSIHYLVASKDVWDEGVLNNRPIGVVAFMPVNSVTCNPHIAILPEFRGTGTDVMDLAIDWMFDNTECKKLVAHPPEYNAAMIRVFEKCGFNREGYSPGSILKDGVMHGRILMGRAK